VLSISLTLALRTLAGGFHYQRQARTLADATLLAQSLLTRIGSDLPLRPGADTGIFLNGFTWDVQIDGYGDSSDRQEWPVAAYTVTVRVLEGRNAAKPVVVLTTLRLGPKS